MKNVKKSLALLLALVMILGLGTMGASAAFNDADSIDTAYADAVNVMSGMGILAGSDDDRDGKFDFNPTGNVTRAQAAKMVTYMILGKDAAERLPAKAMFNDVKATDWSAKYVYYLANKKIINGRGNGNFAPNDSVTATELAKMLLAAAGYGQADEFVGAGWDIVVFSRAVELGLYDGTNATDYDIAATREEASLYVFNAMTNIPLVKYLKEDGIYDYLDVAKSTFATSKYNFKEVTGIITSTKDSGNDYTVLTYDKDPSATVVADTINLNIDATSALVGHKVKIAYSDKKLYDKGTEYYNGYYINDLSKEVAVAAYTVNYKGVYTKLGGSNASILAYDTAETKGPLESFTYWLNNSDSTYAIKTGSTTYGSDFTTTYTISKIKTEAEKLAVPFWTVTGSFILDETGKVIAFKATSYTIEKVTKINTTAGAESITLSFSSEKSNTTANDMVIEYDGIAVGDFVSVTLTGNVYKLEKCTLVENVLVNTLGSDGTINGTYRKSTGTNKLTATSATPGDTYDIYLDMKNTYVYLDKVDGAAKNTTFVYYLYSVSGSSSLTSNTKYYAKCLSTDGVITDYLITDTVYNTLSTGKSSSMGGVIVNELCTIIMATDSTYYDNLTVATLDNSSTNGIVSNSEPFTSNYRINSTSTTGNYLLTGDVEYIYAITDTSGSTLQTKVSITKTKPVANTSTPYTIYYYPTKVTGTTNNYTFDKVFVVTSPADTAGTSYIYSSGFDANTFRSSQIGYTTPNANGGTDKYLYAFIDGEYLKDIKFKNSTANNANLFNFYGSDYLTAGFYSYTIDAQGYYTLASYDGINIVGSTDTDKNKVVSIEEVTGIYNNMISTTSTYDVNAANAVIVDFSGVGVTTLEQLADYVNSDDYTVKVSFWSYLYDDYEGTDKATTTAIYINDIR